MKIEVLYIRECPNHAPVMEGIKKILQECQLSQEVAELEVKDRVQAVALAFPGSPTVRVNGADIERYLPKLMSYGLSCRTYVRDDGRRQGVPPDDLIRTAIVDALRQGDLLVAGDEARNLTSTIQVIPNSD
jgi:hypothetical protein